VPATNASAPAAAACSIVSSAIPPSTSIRTLQILDPDPAPDVADLGQHLRHERLAAEPGLDRHDQQSVHVRQDFQVRLDRGVPVDGQAGLGPAARSVLASLTGFSAASAWNVTLYAPASA
jgi:hypothetical protein